MMKPALILKKVCVCVCVQIIWRQVHEAHDLCMSVWTVSVSNPSHVGGCAPFGQMESEECHYKTVSLHSFGWSFHLVEKNVNWPVTYMSLRHIVPSRSSFLSKQKDIICSPFIFLGHHSKEIPRHHCKYFKCIFCCPTKNLIRMWFFLLTVWNVFFNWFASSFVLQKSGQTPGMSKYQVNLKKQFVLLSQM